MQLNTKKTVTVALILLLSVYLLTFSISGIIATEDSWATKAPMQVERGRLGVGVVKAPMQVERSRLGVAVVNGKIYAFGGDDVHLSGNCLGAYGYYGKRLNTTEEYDPVSDTWTFKASMPTPRCSFGVAVYQNKIYCIGGRTSDGVTGVNEVYDPATDTWETKTPMPTPRMELQANVVDEKIYLIGGNVEYTTSLNLTEVYDPETDTWTTKTSAPYRITSAASAVADNKIYFLATESILNLGAFTQIYNTENDGWSIGADAPTYGGSAVTAGVTSGLHATKQILFFGESSTHVYFPSNDSWALGEPMLTSRGWPGVAVLNDTFYVIGGIKAPFDGYIVMTTSVATNEYYTPDEYTSVPADTKIYIRADGSIEPSTANITTADNILYSFTGDNYDRMIIERDNIIVDGNGYTLQGTESLGIALFQRHNVTIKNLTITQFSTAGIGIQSSTRNFIVGNDILSNMNDGIKFCSGASNNTVTGNNIKYNGYMSGIHFYDGSTNNVISSNSITNNCYGIFSNYASGNIISGNNIQFNGQYDIRFYSSSNNTITGNNIGNTEWYYGLYLIANSNRNLIAGNNITNSEIGIVLENSTNNQIYHNNFIDNELAHAEDNSSNIWDNGEEGNYWSNYNGTDNNRDGIGDTPYVINENSKDNYPLMAPITIFDAGTWEWTSYNVSIISNSTVSDFSFNPESALVRFGVEGETGTAGFCRVTIPKDFLDAEDEWTVRVDGSPLTPLLKEDTDSTYLYFTYQHSTKTVEIIGTDAIPEFPPWTILPLLLTATVLAIFCRRKLKTIKE
jgi:parallel beta-helix repeat protein